MTIGTVAPGLAKIHAKQLGILSRVESRGKRWTASELGRFNALSSEFDKLAAVAETFLILDDKHFGGRLSAAGVTISISDHIPDGIRGRFNVLTDCIELRSDLPEHETSSVLLHELAHAAVDVLDDADDPADHHGERFRDWCERLGESYGLPSPLSSDDAASWPFNSTDPVESEIQRRLDAKRQMARNGWLCNMVEAERNIRRQVESEYQTWQRNEQLIEAAKSSPSAANLVLTRGIKSRPSPF